MTNPIDIKAPEHQDQTDLDNPLRAIIIVNSPSVPEGSMDERLLDTVQSFDDMNDFFDEFDESIAVPNEGSIKYEVGSDGLVVIVLDSVDLKDKVLAWIDDYIIRFQDSLEDNVDGNTGEILKSDDESDQPKKKTKA